MKRIWAAVVIFCLCIVFSVYCTCKNNSVLKDVRGKIENIKIYCQNGDYNNARNNSLALKDKWQKNKMIIETTLDRSEIKSIENAIKILPRFISEEKFDNAVEQCDTAICEIDYLLENEKIKFENVF